ncbi:hypothetical protein F511_41095 [Dorcoceras hygrometricum]|uniref:Uncharacterized protein n=1 Tax=Dorcoceras hygrometricum TaxID=472368 RepID=A0A2Z7CPJ6_9LAMI|nr:hypothetical protein F511_41095 [Dorcoceras hygrometricum]
MEQETVALSCQEDGYSDEMEFSESGMPMKSSCKKNTIKVEYRLLNDIIAKALTAKAGSFDAVTQESFVMMVAIMTCCSREYKGLHWVNFKAIPSLKILPVKFVGTYIAKNKSTPVEFLEEDKKIGDTEKAAAKARMAAEMEARSAVDKAKHLEAIRSKAKAAADPTVNRKRKIVGGVAPSLKAFAIVPNARIEKTTKSSKVFDDESLSLEEILMSLPDEVLPPSMRTELPVTKIRWSQDVKIREVDWRHRSLPQIAPEEKWKQVLVEYTKGTSHFSSTYDDEVSMHYQFYPSCPSTSWARSLNFLDGVWSIQMGQIHDPSVVGCVGHQPLTAVVTCSSTTSFEIAILFSCWSIGERDLLAAEEVILRRFDIILDSAVGALRRHFDQLVRHLFDVSLCSATSDCIN